MKNNFVPTCEEFLLSENKLDNLCSYYTDRIYEGTYDDVMQWGKEKIDDAFGETLDNIADFTVKKALPFAIEYAKKGWDAIGKEGQKALAIAGEWCVKNQDAIFLALDIVDYASDILLVAGIVTGGTSSAAGMGIKLAIKGAKGALKKEAKSIMKDVAEKKIKERVKKSWKKVISKEAFKNRAKLAGKFIIKKVGKLCDMVKRIMNVIEGIIALLKSLFSGNKKDINLSTEYNDINLFRNNIYGGRIDFDSLPTSVPDTFLLKWKKEGLEEDNEKEIETLIKDFQNKCLSNKVNSEIIRGIVSFIMNGVDESKNEYLTSYIETNKEISTQNSDVKTGDTESYTEDMNMIGYLADETTQAYEDMTDYIEKFLIKYGYVKNNGGSSFVNKKTNVSFYLKTLSELFFNILHQFVVSLKD